MSSTEKHWVALASPVYGHKINLLRLFSNLVLRSEDAIFTIAIHHSEVANCIKERDANLKAQNNEAAKDRFRIVPLHVDAEYKPDPSAVVAGFPHFLIADESKYAFRKVWKHLSPAPTILITDLFLVPDYEPLREESPSVQVFVYFCSFYASFWQHYAPRSLGGDGDFLKNVEAEWKKEQENPTWANDLSIFYSNEFTNRRAVASKIPGLPEYYEYERNPGHMPMPPVVKTMLETGTTQVYQQADGVLVASDKWYEPEASKAAEEWYKETTGKSIYPAGIPYLMDAPVKEQSASLSSDRQEDDVIAFLDRQKDKSVLYISFGTVFFPLTFPESVNILVDVLLTSKRPFILSRAAQLFGPQSDEFERRLAEASEKGLCFISEWVPQTSVLNHKSVSAFITHGGWNSSVESFVAGVPTIHWPFTADQPAIALKHSIDLDTSWELLEVRGAVVQMEPPKRQLPSPLQGTQQALRAEFERVFAETDVGHPVGDRKRRNMDNLAKRLGTSLQKGGDNWNSLGALLTL